MKKYLILFIYIPSFIFGQSIDFKVKETEKTFDNLLLSVNDIVINEIMFDPSPRVNLPEVEYIEVYNSSANDISIENWKLIVGKKKYNLPSYILGSEQYLILTKDASVFTNINVLEVKITSLTNSGTTLKLVSNTGDLINQVSYSTSLFSDGSKKDGGWSLELINPKNYCLGGNNWKGSTNILGGTPGLSNSIVDFDFFPETANYIYKVTANDNVDVITTHFNSFINENTISIESNYSNNYIFNSENKADGSSEITINLDTPTGDNVYYFIFNDLLSCDGGKISSDTIWVSNFGSLNQNDIIINEVMFNPKDNSAEFIEIFNNTDKFLSLRNVYISNFTTTDDDISEKDGEKRISDENIIFKPHSYCVITKDAKSIMDSYKSNLRMNFVEISSIPKLNNSNGNLAVLDNAFNFVDKMVYSSEMHVGLISTDKQKGISLERIKSNNPSLDYNNWTSASQVSGGATPALINSVSTMDFVSEDTFEIYPEVFTPNNDGTFDVVELKYKVNSTGIVANVKIFDSNGVFIKEIANNILLGKNGSFIWNGMNKDNSLCKKGIYIFWVEFFDNNGNVKTYKKICVLG